MNNRYDLLLDIEMKYGFTENLINVVNNRICRMALERLFAILLFNEEYIAFDNCSNFGLIQDFPNKWEQALPEQIEAYPGAIIKTWHER